MHHLRCVLMLSLMPDNICPQSRCVYEYYLCSSTRHMCIFHWTQSERIRALWADTAVTTQQWACLSVWTQSPERDGEGQEHRGGVLGGRNNHNSSQITPGSLAWPNCASDFPLHHGQSCAAARLSARDTHTLSLCNIKAECSLFSNQ